MMNGRPHGHQGLINRLQRDFYNLRADACPRPQMKALSIVSAPWLENAANPASGLSSVLHSDGYARMSQAPCLGFLDGEQVSCFPRASREQVVYS